MGFYYYDATYILVLIGAVICLIANANVKGTFNRFARTMSRSGYNGREVAELMLTWAGINDVTVQHIPGNLTDHYDPGNLTVNLSDSVCYSRSIAAIGVAAHECGHAMQDAQNYVPLRFREKFVPIANIGSTLAWPVILIGLFINNQTSSTIINFGIYLFSFAVIFQLITLPVEFNASRRALAVLQERGILEEDELNGTRQVLKAAALTYVAGAAASILQLLRLMILFGGGRRRD